MIIVANENFLLRENLLKSYPRRELQYKHEILNHQLNGTRVSDCSFREVIKIFLSFKSLREFI